MENNKLTFMNSLRHYIVTNGICDFSLQFVYNMVCRSVYHGVFEKIMIDLMLMPDNNYFFSYNKAKYLDDGTGTTVLSSLASNYNVMRYFEEKNITYSFKDNVHHIEAKKYPCNVTCSGHDAGYRKECIEITKMIIDCSFSFNNEHRPLSFSYKVDHLEDRHYYKHVKDFRNLNMVLLQPDFQEDISMLVTKSKPTSNVVSKKDVFTSLKFVQRISEDIPAGICSYLVSPDELYADDDNFMSEEEIFDKIVDVTTNDDTTLDQISRSSGIPKKTVLMALCYIQNKINIQAPGNQ